MTFSVKKNPTARLMLALAVITLGACSDPHPNAKRQVGEPLDGVWYYVRDDLLADPTGCYRNSRLWVFDGTDVWASNKGKLIKDPKLMDIKQTTWNGSILTLIAKGPQNQFAKYVLQDKGTSLVRKKVWNSKKGELEESRFGRFLRCGTPTFWYSFLTSLGIRKPWDER